ncbi:MAG: hypothetical protein U1F65_10760 [Verrucomicrobiota bacterium]
MITVEHLTKVFGAKRAVDGISFTVNRGEVLGFLGPGGAEQIRYYEITGFLPPTDGTVSVGGHNMAAAHPQKHRLPSRKRPGLHGHDGAGLPELCRRDSRPARRGARQRSSTRRGTLLLQSVLHQNVDAFKGYRHRTCFADPSFTTPTF